VFEPGVGGAGHRLGDEGAEAFGGAVLGGAGLSLVGQAGEEAEVGCRARLEGDGQHREEEGPGEGGEDGEGLCCTNRLTASLSLSPDRPIPRPS
jgi:hypothetical protein